MEFKNETDTNQRGGVRGIMAERRGRVKEHVYKGPINKD